jgi:hypothetical protein
MMLHHPTATDRRRSDRAGETLVSLFIAALLVAAIVTMARVPVRAGGEPRPMPAPAPLTPIAIGD